MQEAVEDCSDYVPDDGSEWHFDVSSQYNCAKMEDKFSDGDCSGYDRYTG